MSPLIHTRSLEKKRLRLRTKLTAIEKACARAIKRLPQDDSSAWHDGYVAAETALKKIREAVAMLDDLFPKDTP